MIAKSLVAALMLCVGLGCSGHRIHGATVTATERLPRIEIDEALTMARHAAELEYRLDMYTVDRCEREAAGWWIWFRARDIDEVGANWSRPEKERWVALGNHFSVYVHDNRTTRLHGGR